MKHGTFLVVLALTWGSLVWGTRADEKTLQVGVVIERATALIDAGQFAEAEDLLKQHGAASDTRSDAGDLLEIIRRTRLDYSLTAEQLLAKVQRVLPDATMADLDRWRAANVLQYRPIDGEIRYFSSEPNNLFRFCDEARDRRPTPVPRSGWELNLAKHASMLLEKAERAATPLVHPVRQHVRYSIEIPADHPLLRPGADVKCWLPYPQVYRQQGSVKLIKTDPPDAYVAPEGTPQRTVFFERKPDEMGKPVTFSVEFEYVTSAYCPRLDPKKAREPDHDSALYREFTHDRPPHIQFTDEVRRLVPQIVGDEKNLLLRARRIFLWCCENLRYCSEREYSTIHNISDKALTTRKGDCGVQALAFITLCRAAGIPARWQSGWETLPNGWNMHDWAEFYVEPWGWLPADPSYGLLQHDNESVREFYFGHLDPYRLIVNLDYARPLDPPKASFRSEPNDFQRGEVEIDGHNLYFGEWKWHFAVETMPLDRDMAGLLEALAARVPDLIEEGHLPGAVIAIGRKTDTGFEEARKAFGFLQTEPRRTPMPAGAIFDMASVTKPVATGTSLLKLIDAGRVGRDDPVGKYLPEFRDGKRQEITVRHLMTHTSGLPAYIGAAEQKRIKAEAGDVCPDAIRARIRACEPEFEPGKRVRYSCLNAILCAEIVEQVTGQPLDEFARDNVFAPLHMEDTGFNPPAEKRERIAPTSCSKNANGEWECRCGRVHDPLAAMQGGVSGNAGLFSTAEDLGRFCRMILNGGELEGVRILNQETVEMSAALQNEGAVNGDGKPDRRGLLWDLYDVENGVTKAFGHTGFTGTALRIYPEAGVYVVVLSNGVHPDGSGDVRELRKFVFETAEAVFVNPTPTSTATRDH